MKNIIFLFTTFTVFTACQDNDTTIEPSCGENVIVNETRYNATDTTTYSITNVSVTDTCIVIRISSNGCDGKTWATSLIDSEQVSTTNPPQRFLRLELVNNEDCQTLVERANTFDISSLVSNSNEPLTLNLEGWGDPIFIN